MVVKDLEEVLRLGLSHHSLESISVGIQLFQKNFPRDILKWLMLFDLGQDWIERILYLYILTIEYPLEEHRLLLLELSCSMRIRERYRLEGTVFKRKRKKKKGNEKKMRRGGTEEAQSRKLGLTMWVRFTVPSRGSTMIVGL